MVAIERINYIIDFVDEYELDFNIEEFNIESYEKPFIASVFITFYQDWAFRLFFTIKTAVANGDGFKFEPFNKPVYNFSKKKLMKMNMEEIYTVREKFIKFVLLTEQIKLDKQILNIEEQLESVAFLARSPILKGLK